MAILTKSPLLPLLERNPMFARLIGLTAMLPVLLAGAVAAEPPTLDGRGGVLETASGRFVFSPTVCGMAIEDGQHDIEIYGPGTDPDGRVIFFELSSTGRYLTVGFDIDSVFASPDEELGARDFDLEVSGSLITASGLELRHQNGEAA